MSIDNPGTRLPTEFSFESYVERQFVLLNERLDRMTTLAEQLGVDEEILATAIPALIGEVNTLTQSVADEKAAKEAALAEAQAAEAAAAADSAERDEAKAKVAALEAELAAIQTVADKLGPVAEAAKEAAPAAPAGGGAPAGGDPLPPPDGGGGTGPGGTIPGSTV